MIQVTLLTVGRLKEGYLRDACAEYEKRLSAFCRLSRSELPEAKVPDEGQPGQVEAALAAEGARILAAMPPDAYKVALCVEGQSYDSPALAGQLEQALARRGKLCLVIGSSHGLHRTVKEACDLCLSLSPLTFPHQLTRVLALEVLYRSFTITAGKRYHK
ncbi:MAG: 23S rRNA (pseudouridine(1915)-N(3))-methyltransferase RlmH [Eubacteriales bacterium]